MADDTTPKRTRTGLKLPGVLGGVCPYSSGDPCIDSVALTAGVQDLLLSTLPEPAAKAYKAARAKLPPAARAKVLAAMKESDDFANKWVGKMQDVWDAANKEAQAKFGPKHALEFRVRETPERFELVGVLTVHRTAKGQHHPATTAGVKVVLGSVL
ncbi:MAG: hypothetical protein V4510_07395 [bacterium]